MQISQSDAMELIDQSSKNAIRGKTAVRLAKIASRPQKPVQKANRRLSRTASRFFS